MATARQQLDGFLKKYSPEMEKLGRAVIAYLRKRLPGAICLVYDNYNALSVGFWPTAKASALPISIALYPRWATLFLMFGATRDDPEGLLEGKGPRIRSVRLDGPGGLKSEPVDALVTAAVLQAGWTLDRKAKGEVVIQSVSEKQRPRRP